MELAIATPKGNNGTIEVSELAFGTEFNQDLVHQTVVAFLAGARQGTAARRLVPLSLAVAASRCVRKVQVVLERVPSRSQSGVEVVLPLLPSLRITAEAQSKNVSLSDAFDCLRAGPSRIVWLLLKSLISTRQRPST